MKGICFKEMLFHATIEGRKTQTRRILNPQPDYVEYPCGDAFMKDKKSSYLNIQKINPRYKVGETLYLKEPYFNGFQKIVYRYDHSIGEFEKSVKWKNKLFMFEKYARYFIQITDVICDRLQDISDDDCIKEGIDWDMAHEFNWWCPSYNDPDSGGYPAYKSAYKYLIDEINGKGTWESNPYVWVYDYKLINKKL